MWRGLVREVEQGAGRRGGRDATENLTVAPVKAPHSMHADPRPRAAVTADHRHVYLALWLRDQPPQPSGGAMAYHRAITAGEDRPELLDRAEHARC